MSTELVLLHVDVMQAGRITSTRVKLLLQREKNSNVCIDYGGAESEIGLVCCTVLYFEVYNRYHRILENDSFLTLSIKGRKKK